eukprot:CAMPEP_0197899054 /NCGR_PEP_ID=MMETSP1439-20131203/45531_1 /TAXON_ID=66791 /ORGANISM="Gonyaulax spinifera, Strain CCMP409" /LENGTH=79 /DNA_ID=CAMNT_0043519819 /DNA_START=80 /DNA_END=316 /DNA_ORIENTATION=+
MSQAVMNSAFNAIDRNHDGQISRSEFAAALGASSGTMAAGGMAVAGGYVTAESMQSQVLSATMPGATYMAAPTTMVGGA